MKNYINLNEQELGDALPYVDFLPQFELPIIQLKDCSLLILFRLDGIHYEGPSEAQMEDFSRSARYALEQLPDEGVGFVLSNLLIRDTPKLAPLNNNPDAPPLIQFLHSKKQAFCDDVISKSFSNHILCGLQYYPVNKKAPPLIMVPHKKKVHSFDYDQLKSVTDQLEHGFIALSRGFAHFGFHALTREESFAALFRLINFTEPAVYMRGSLLCAQLAHSRIQFHCDDGYLVVNDTEYISIIGIIGILPHTAVMHLQRLYELEFPLIMRQSMKFISKGKLLKDQKNKWLITRILLMFDEKIEDYRTRIKNSTELPFDWHFSILVRAKDKNTLYVRRSEIKGLLKERGFSPIEKRKQLEAGFYSNLPGYDRFAGQKRIMFTGDAGNLFSAYALDPGDSAPTDYLQDHSHGIFAYNQFTSQARTYHRVICSPSAGEKSLFLVRDLISHLTAANPMIWVIDLSASFLDLFELLKEEIPTETAVVRGLPDGSNLTFNPFLLADPQSPVSDDQFDFCVKFLKLIAGSEFVSSDDEKAMRDGLNVYFNTCGILLRNRRKERQIPPLTLLSEILEMKVRHPGLTAAFQLWTDGRRGVIFNGGCETSQNSRYCYFDLRDLESDPELKTAIIYVILYRISKIVTDERLLFVQKRLVLADAQSYIYAPVLSSLIKELIKIDSNWNFMLDLVTQSINDIEPDAVLTNFKQAFFFSGQKNIEDSFSKLRLTDRNIEQYRKLDASRNEVLYWSDDAMCRVLHSATDPYAYWLAVTNAGERAMKRCMIERFGNIRAAIEELIRITEGCQTANERLSALRTYFRED